MNIKTIFFSLIFLIRAAGDLGGQPLPLVQIDQHAQRYIENTKNSGLVIAVVRGDETLVQGYGQLARRDERRPGGQTLFELGALTQVFTTTLAVLESRRGAFHLEESIRPFVPEDIDVPDFQPLRCVQITIPQPGRPPERVTSCSPDPLADRVCIAFCDLASHTSGLPNSPVESFTWIPLMPIRETGEPCPEFDRDQLYAALGRYELKNVPGAEFRYSNLGIAVLGNLVADTRGESYESLLQRRLLEPLDLKDTRLTLSAQQAERLAPGHTVRGRAAAPWPASAMGPSCGLKSTADDLLTFVRANLRARDEELSEAFEAVQQPYVDVRFPGWDRSTQAGYGWLVSLLSEESNLPVTWLSGGTSGHRSFVGFVKDTRTGVIILSNNAEPVTEMGFAVLGLIHEP